MKHFTSSNFWQQYYQLPAHVRTLADKNFNLLKQDSTHPSLKLKKTGRYWSVRIGLKHRALAVEISEGMLWFWIGNHSDYDKLLKQKP